MESLLKNPRILLKMGKNWSITDIEELDIRLMDVGWDVSGGKSRNVWGNVALPKEFLSYAEEYVKAKNRRPSIWTAYDDALYTRDENGTWHVTPENLPSTISATFKCSRNRFSPIVENMAMRIAVALDLPTSYNFLVKYTPELHEKITKHINPAGATEGIINEYGVVSVDMLQGYVTGKGGYSDNPDSIDTTIGDQLVSFSDSERIIRNGFPQSSDDGLVENWMKSVRNFSSSYLANVPEAKQEECLAKINSRIARSTLLRTFLGDCDFTALNSGYIYNANKNSLKYAPNFDYGEAFTSLRVAKLEGFHFDEKDLKFILEHQPNYLEMKKYEQSKSIREIAQTYESGTSEENLKYISTHFEDDILEFLMSLNQAVEDNVISDIIYSYAQKNEFGDQLITIEEAQMFDEYLTERANWISFVIIKNIMEAEPEKFISKIIKDKLGSHANFSSEKLQGFIDKKYDTLPPEEKKKIENYPTELERYDFIKANYPEEFSLFNQSLNKVIDNFWRRPLSQNFMVYFNTEFATPVLSKDEVKGLFLKQFVNKTFEKTYRIKNAPVKTPATAQNKGKA